MNAEDTGDSVLVFRGLPSLLGGGACVAGEDARRTVRKVGTAFRGRSANSFLEEVLFAPEPVEQVGRKNGRNAVFLPGARRGLGVRRSVAEGVCCRMLWGEVWRGGWDQAVEGLECRAKQTSLCFAW